MNSRPSLHNFNNGMNPNRTARNTGQSNRQKLTMNSSGSASTNNVARMGLGTAASQSRKVAWNASTKTKAGQPDNMFGGPQFVKAKGSVPGFEQHRSAAKRGLSGMNLG